MFVSFWFNKRLLVRNKQSLIIKKAEQNNGSPDHGCHGSGHHRRKPLLSWKESNQNLHKIVTFQLLSF